jgi:nicotinamidase/pyrazinamidase
MKKSCALLIVDLQIDFCPGGLLPVPRGDRVVPVMNRYISLFRERGLPIIASRDWHPEKSSHFKAYGGSWPNHCIRETKGASFHPDLHLPEETIVVSKGTDPEKDAYSAFLGKDGTGRLLAEILGAMGIEELYIGGLATDYCVRESVLEGLQRGLRVTLLTDASAGVDLEAGDSEKATGEMMAAGAKVTTVDLLAGQWQEE